MKTKTGILNGKRAEYFKGGLQVPPWGPVSRTGQLLTRKMVFDANVLSTQAKRP